MFKKAAFISLLCAIQIIVVGQKRVAIIGGGLAGIATAHFIHLKDTTAIITVFEKNEVIGGNAHTIQTTNNKNETIFVDAGPQYFADKSWENYIALVKEYGFYSKDDIYAFHGSVILQQDGQTKPNLVTPFNGSFRGEKLKTLIQFKKIFDLGHKIYIGKTKKYSPTIGDWVNEMPFSAAFKTNTVIPFLAADLGTSTKEISNTSTAELVKLFAFRKATANSTFKIMKYGMGTIAQKIGERLALKKVQFKTACPVTKIDNTTNGFDVYFQKNNENSKEEFDYIIFATHPYQMAKIIQQDNNFQSLLPILNDFEYFKAHIVIHRYSDIVNKKYPSFFNIHIDEQTNMISNTMDLGRINKKYDGIYKSWVSKSIYDKIIEMKLLIHEEYFSHPLITPKFIANIERLKKTLPANTGIYIAGGWSQGLEMQETAVLSGKEAAEKYEEWLLKNK